MSLGESLIKNDNKLQVKEIVERLIWINDPIVIDYLVDASIITPLATCDIVFALEKFVNSRKGLEAIKKVGTSGDTDTLKAYFDIANKKSMILLSVVLQLNI